MRIRRKFSIIAATVAIALAGIGVSAGMASARVRPPPPPVTLRSVSCVDATHCFAVGYINSGTFQAEILATTDGSTWASQPVPAGVNLLQGVSCVNVTHCVAVGSGIIVATTDGRTWVSQTAPAGVGLFGVSCVDTTHCVAVGRAGFSSVILATTDGSPGSLRQPPLGWISRVCPV